MNEAMAGTGNEDRPGSDRSRWHRRFWVGVVAVCALVPSCSEVPPVRAHDGKAQEGFHIRDATQGTLVYRAHESGSYQPAPTLKTDVTMQVTGLILRATVRQEFRNPGSEWAEGIYVFPLPESAAVDHLRMRIGERMIDGQIKEKVEAKKTYAKAKREGKRASLLEQERPNVFTASVANIGPGDRITVEIEYQQTVRYDQGRFQLRFPMVVGPRYIPGSPIPISEQVGETDGHGWAFNTDQVPDASRITPPVQHPSQGAMNPISLTIDLDPGLPLSRLESTYHQIHATSQADGRHLIHLQEGQVAADRDFELIWEPEAEQAPKAALFREEKDGETYGLFMVLPPAGSALERLQISREIIFVIDTSGSMYGTSIEQAKEALRLALDRLSRDARFNIIQFNNVTSALFHSSQEATKKNREWAIRYVENLRANGGTEMLPAMTRALEGSEQGNRLRQIIFITDGQIGNEAALFDRVRRRLGESRLFTIGIGSAPNSHFMRKAAHFGRGTYIHIGKLSEVRSKIDRLLRKLEHPALTDIRIDGVGWEQTEIVPDRIPDLYLGEPVVVAVKATHVPDRVMFKGRLGNQPWRMEVALDQAKTREGLSVYWARQKIASMLDGTTNADRNGQVRQRVIDLAMKHHVVSKFTSLVAVDITPVRPGNKAQHRHPLKTNLPHGQDYTKIFGLPQLPQTATSATWQILIGLLLLLLAGGIYRWQRQDS